MTKENDLVIKEKQQNNKEIFIKEASSKEGVSLKDIAELCQVSVSTVSKALNDRKDIGKDKKEEIQRVAKELNYVPNYMALGLKSKRTRNIGVLLSEETKTNLMHEHFIRILNSFKDTVEERSYFLTFLNASNSPDRMSYYDQYKYMNFDGILILCADYKLSEVQELLAADIPIVVIDYVTDKHLNVLANNYGDMSRLMQLIYSRGHRKIAYMHGENDMVTLKRIRAYQDYLKERNVKIPESYLLTCPYRDYEKASALTKVILSYSNRPTCIIYPDDLTAVAGLNMMQESRMVIPRDISVAGYDGLNLVNIVRPRITTIRQDTISMGIQAGNRLINRIEVPLAAVESETVVVDGMVEPGESVAVIGLRR